MPFEGGSRNRSYTHGHALRGKWSPTYVSWTNMVQRCTNPRHPKYSAYGGRGIVVCRQWLSFSGFLADMGEKPEGTTIERIDNDAGYEPANCRWATNLEQARNKRRTQLSPQLASLIRQLRAAHGWGKRRIARHIGISEYAVHGVLALNTWKEN